MKAIPCLWEMVKIMVKILSDTQENEEIGDY
jgi:hypothetical protein